MYLYTYIYMHTCMYILVVLLINETIQYFERPPNKFSADNAL
jgi:hypothetical protein